MEDQDLVQATVEPAADVGAVTYSPEQVNAFRDQHSHEALGLHLFPPTRLRHGKMVGLVLLYQPRRHPLQTGMHIRDRPRHQRLNR
jgi:hypothetical protein